MIFKRPLQIFLMACIFFGYPVLAQANDLSNTKSSPYEIGKEKISNEDFQIFLTKLSEYIADPKIKKEQKIESVIKAINIIELRGSYFQRETAIKEAEDILFTKYSDKKITTKQITFLIPYSVDDQERWNFRRSPEEVGIFLQNRIEYSADPSMMLAVYWRNARDYARKGQFELADKELAKARKLTFKGFGGGYKRSLQIITEMMQFQYLIDRGDLDAVIKMYPKINAETNWFLNDFFNASKENADFAATGAPGLMILPRADLILGNFQHAIDISTQIINVSGGDGVKDPNAIQKRAELYSIIAKAYKKLGNDKLAVEYEDKSFNANLGYGGISSAQRWKFFYELVGLKLYKEAREFIPSMLYWDTQAYSGSELAKYYPIYDELPKFVDAVESSNNSLDAWAEHFKKTVVLLESGLEDFRASGNKNILLEQYGTLYGMYVVIGDQQLAAFYAKQYTNLLQELRASIGGRPQELEIFTEGYSDQLKKFVDTYLEIGDVESARLTLKIIKQNEFSDYLSQRASETILVSKLYVPEDQEAILRKIDLRAAEKEALKTKLKNIDQSNPKNREISSLTIKSIELKDAEISELRMGLKNAVHTNKRGDSSDASRQIVGLKRNDEALIDFYVQKNTITLIITTNKGSQTFSSKIDRAEFRKNLLDLYSNISSPKRSPMNAKLASKLSNELMLSSIASLRERGISALKIRTDDLIAIIPIGVLPVGETDMVSLFDIDIQGLSDKKVLSKPNKSLKAFGVTRAFKEYPALTSVKDEVQYISSIPDGASNKIAYVDGEFTKNNLLDAFNSGVSTIHIASHYSPTKSAGSSGRLLLGDGSTISIEELSSKIQPKISPSLVTLSACDTGLPGAGEGMSNLEGLSNVFNLKGINYVLGTLWEVSDESTADFMRLYYLLTVKNGINPVEALRLTQMVFKAGNLSPIFQRGIELPNDAFIAGFKQRLSNYSAPFYWAPFQILAI